MKLLVATITLALLTSACANGPCRRLREPQLAEGQAAGMAKPAAPPVATAPAGPTGSTGGPVTSLFVYKADGSLQCGTAKGLSLEEMEKQLRGVPVLSRDKRPDGKMHIQVCGSPTGMINVFEINETSLKEAEARGFKKL